MIVVKWRFWRFRRLRCAPWYDFCAGLHIGPFQFRRKQTATQILAQVIKRCKGRRLMIGMSDRTFQGPSDNGS